MQLLRGTMFFSQQKETPTLPFWLKFLFRFLSNSQAEILKFSKYKKPNNLTVKKNLGKILNNINIFLFSIVFFCLVFVWQVIHKTDHVFRFQSEKCKKILNLFQHLKITISEILSYSILQLQQVNCCMQITNDLQSSIDINIWIYGYLCIYDTNKRQKQLLNFQKSSFFEIQEIP